MQQGIERKRKNPHQQRARQTIELILEATAQVLERSGDTKFTTNHIARRAGYSIGTLYRYFPDKMSILREMALADLELQEKRARELLAGSQGATGHEVIAHLVSSTLQPFRRSRARKSMLLSLLSDAELVARASDVHLRIMHMFQSRLAEIDPARFRQPDDMSCMVLSGALVGSIRTTLFTEPGYLNDPEYERSLIDLVIHIVSNRN